MRSGAAGRMCSLSVMLLLLACMQAAGQAKASALSASPGAESNIRGTVRIWGDPSMRGMLTAWERGFEREHPAVTFDNKLLGTVTAIAGVDHQVADIAAMGRDLTTEEGMSFEWIYRYKPLQLRVSSGSLKTPGHLPALAILVNQQNPVDKLSFDQLRAIFGCCGSGDEKAGGTRPLAWGDVGVAGAWAEKPVHPVGYAFDKGIAAFFRKAVLHNSYQWNCEYRAFPDDSALIKALTADPNAIAVGTVADADANVKVVAVVASQETQSVLPTVETVEQHTYPLARYTYLIVNRGAEHPLTPAVQEFLRYVLSDGGQRDIATNGSFLPLPASVAAQERNELNVSLPHSAPRSVSPEE